MTDQKYVDMANEIFNRLARTGMLGIEKVEDIMHSTIINRVMVPDHRTPKNWKWTLAIILEIMEKETHET